MSKDNTCPTCLDVGGSTYPCLTCGKKVKWTGKVEFRSGQQEDKPTKAEQCYRCGCAPCRCGEDDSKPEKPEQLAIAVEGIVDDIVTHAYHHPPVPKEFYRARIKALLATEYDRGKVDGLKQALELRPVEQDSGAMDSRLGMDWAYNEAVRDYVYNIEGELKGDNRESGE